MPLWTIYHPDNIFTSQAEKDKLAANITASYDILPPFYVVIAFISLPATSIYRSGKPITEQEKPFVRFSIHHLARHAGDNEEGLEEGYARGNLVVERGIKECVIDKGYGWEYSVIEEDRELWKIDGLKPPPFKSEAMYKWKEDDKVSPY